MIGVFWDALFRYGDKLKAQERYEDLEICREIQKMLHLAYMKSMSVMIPEEKRVRKPKDSIEALILRSPSVQVLKDPSDGSINYQWGTYTYDSPLKLARDIFDDYEEVKRRLERSNRELLKLSREVTELRHEMLRAEGTMLKHGITWKPKEKNDADIHKRSGNRDKRL